MTTAVAIAPVRSYGLGFVTVYEPAWYEYQDPFDAYFDDWFVKQAVYLWQAGYALEIEWDVLDRFRIRARSHGA